LNRTTDCGSLGSPGPQFALPSMRQILEPELILPNYGGYNRPGTNSKKRMLNYTANTVLDFERRRTELAAHIHDVLASSAGTDASVITVGNCRGKLY